MAFPTGDEEYIRLALKFAVQNQKQSEAEINAFAAFIKRKAVEMKTDFATIGTGMKSISDPEAKKSIDQAVKGLQATENAANKTGKSLLSLDNIARTAFGTFVAMGIFLVTQFIAQAIAKTLDGVKQLELAFFNLAVAEKSLSEQGIEITPQDFQDIIVEVEKLNLAISKIDITKGIGDLATGLRDLGLTADQLKELAKAAAIIATSEGLSMENVAKQLVMGLPHGGRGLADLDIQVDALIIKQKALDAELVKDEEAWNNLTGAQRQAIETQALYLIVLESAEDKLANLELLEDSVTIASQKLTSAWEDFTASAGEDFSPFIVSGLRLITNLLIGLGKAIKITSTLFQIGLAANAAALFTFRDLLMGNIHSLDEYTEALMRNYAVAKAVIKDIFTTAELSEDTPTGEKPSSGNDVIENAEDIAGALEKANEEIIKANLKLEQDLQDIAIDLGRKMVDITAEYAKKRADLEADYAIKIGDIQRDTANKIADINRKAAESRAKAHADQLEKEREFQNKLKEMREDFLMDLEDALHNRDARQILKLIKQYELEKLQAERKHALDQENAKKDEQLRQASYAAERKQAQIEGQQRLADAQRDYAIKMAKLKADEEAEVAAAVLAANRKTEDTIKANQDRLAIIAADLVNQFNLTKQGLDAILALYRMYYGNGGYIDQVMAGMNTTLAGQGNISSSQKPNDRIVNSGTRSGGSGRMAEGGTIIANRPTTVTFGEAGLEKASFTPIGRTGMDVNKIFSSLGSSADGGMGGLVTIALDLSPDLEARVIRNTMSKTAEVITRTRRTK